MPSTESGAESLPPFVLDPEFDLETLERRTWKPESGQEGDDQVVIN